jgi:glycosyltransferase involved in cell wall biosynthesis
VTARRDAGRQSECVRYLEHPSHTNLPSTMIELLLFHIPVIGSPGAGIPELIERGKTGELVPMGQPAALADALVRACRREVPWRAGRFSPPAIIDRMEPWISAMNALRLAGHSQ